MLGLLVGELGGRKVMRKRALCGGDEELREADVEMLRSWDQGSWLWGSGPMGVAVNLQSWVSLVEGGGVLICVKPQEWLRTPQRRGAGHLSQQRGGAWRLGSVGPAAQDLW